MTTRIFIARHGESEGNIDNVFTGTINAKLTKKGKNQAKELAKNAETINIDEIFSSHLLRATETAEFVAKQLDIKLSITENIQEISFGIFQGQKKSTLTGTDLEKSQQLLEAKNAEGVFNIEKRITSFIKLLQALQRSNTYKSILFVGHSNFWSFLIAVLEGKTAKDFIEVRVNRNKFQNGEMREITNLLNSFKIL